MLKTLISIGIHYDFFNYSVLHFQLSSYEAGQSVGVAKTGEPGEKPPDTNAIRTWLVLHVASANSNQIF